MKKLYTKVAVALTGLASLVPVASAQSTLPTPIDAIPGETSFRTLATTVMNFFLGFLGFIAVLVIIYGGVMYVTAQGAQEKIDSAKKIIQYALIGLVIILLSFAIVYTVLQGAPAGVDS